MRALYSILFCVLLLACGDKKKDDNKIYLPDSNGKLNTISIVVDNELWEGSIGESIRDIFAAPLKGLPTDEPMFNMKQIPPQVFDGFAARNRIVLKIEKGNAEATTKIVNEVFANPQTIAVITGKTNKDIIAQLIESKDKIQLSGSSANTMDLMLYEVPISNISKGDSTIVDIVNMRNQITKTKIPSDDDIYMAVLDDYAPSMFTTIIDNKPAYEVRGMWNMKGATMAGPFLTYLIEDKINNRYLVADGYVYALKFRLQS